MEEGCSDGFLPAGDDGEDELFLFFRADVDDVPVGFVVELFGLDGRIFDDVLAPAPINDVDDFGGLLLVADADFPGFAGAVAGAAEPGEIGASGFDDDIEGGADVDADVFHCVGCGQ